MKKAVFILTLLLGLGLYAQELPDITPPSPNAASLGIFGDIPVGPYTGVTNISIPIYEVQSGDLSVPISLRYHASGIRVSQEASWVGLGWALSAGGVITRSIRGFDDLAPTASSIPYSLDTPIPGFEYEELSFNPNGEISNYAPNDLYQYVFDCQSWNYIERGNFWMVTPVSFGYAFEGSDQTRDNHPDKFTFNFGNYSGSMMIPNTQDNQNVLTPTLFKETDLDIKYYTATDSWIAKDKQGNTYYFNTKEKGLRYSHTRGSVHPHEAIDEDEDDLDLNFGEIFPRTYSWYLDYIISPSGDRIDFEYDTDEHSSKSTIVFSESEEKLITPLSCSGYTCQRSFTNSYSASMVVMDDVFLKKISTPNSTVNFYTSDRNDVERYDTTLAKAQKLDAIVITNNQEEHSRYEFVHNTTNSKLDRLMLNELREVSDSEVKTHKFTYNTSVTLPKKNSYSVDWWGYYNGATNTKLTPELKTIKIGGNGSVLGINEYRGANREQNDDFIKAQMLTEIEYPTKGKTRFTYESNDYSNFNPYVKKEEVSNVVYAGDNNITDNFEIITFNEATFVTINLESLRFTPPGGNCYYVFNAPRGKLEKLNADSTVDINTPVQYFWLEEIPNCDNPESLYKTQFNLDPGTYRLSASIPQSEIGTEYVTLSCSYISEKGDVITTKKGGGLRIKEITNLDYNNDIISRKTYNYNFEEDGVSKSSGILTTPIVNSYFVTYTSGNYINFRLFEDEFPEERSQNSLFRNSSNSIPFSFSANGSLVGYSKVLEKNINHNDITSNGKIIHYFENKEDYYDPAAVPNTPTETNLSNGNYLKKEYYNANDDLVKEIRNQYSQRFYEPVRGINIYATSNYPYIIRTPAGTGGQHRLEGIARIVTSRYRHESIWNYLWKTTTTSYDKNGQNPVTSSIQYFYDNEDHKQVTTQEETKSDGKKIITKIYYPDDVVSISTLGADNLTSTEKLAIDDLKSNKQHRIAESIQVEVYKDEDEDGLADAGELVSRQRTNYRDWGSGIVLPEFIQTSKGTNTLEDRIIYHDYDNKGNPLEVSKAYGTSIVYVWGYNMEYPIAKIENVTFEPNKNNTITTSQQSLITAAENATGSDNDRTIDFINPNGSINYQGNEGLLRQALNNLRASLPNAMVTTYTYDPLIGVTSMTDQRGYTMYYHYDEFNRLKFVKDAKGNLVSENKYNYKN